MKPKYAVLFDRTIGRGFYKVHRAVFKASNGRIWSKTKEGHMLMLTTTGRKSGEPRTTMVLTMPDGADRWVIVGSNGGRPNPPAWLLNLQAKPEAEVMVGGKTFRARAEILDGEARAAIWPRLTAYYPGWAHYETLTDRTLHPVVLTPAE